jgi:prepilin-type processing-associated H-X9-DG protein
MGGARLASLKNPEQQWLMMDVVAGHDWLVANRYAGHCGGVNVLYADGRVVWRPPDATPPISGH